MASASRRLDSSARAGRASVLDDIKTTVLGLKPEGMTRRFSLTGDGPRKPRSSMLTELPRPERPRNSSRDIQGAQALQARFGSIRLHEPQV